MLDVLDYLLHSFNQTTDWNDDNLYSNLTLTSRNLLDFATPRGFRLHTASFVAEQFTAAATLSALPILDGSIAYTYTSKPLKGIKGTSSSALIDLVQGFREVKLPRAPEQARDWEIWQSGRRVDFRDTLYYGRMYIPTAKLEGMHIRRASPAWQYILSFVSDQRPGKGSAMTAQFQRDVGKYSTEYIISSDDLLLGFRGLWNFGADPRLAESADAISSTIAQDSDDILSPPINGRVSAGLEMYYGLLNKGGGLSTGFRFTSLPGQLNPLTLTMTVTPLMGQISTSYAIKASPYSAFCSRFNFNLYSYESELVVGCELWQRRQSSESTQSAVIPQPSTFLTAVELTDTKTEDPVTGVLKARMGSNFDIGFAWEGRFRNVVFSLGTTLDLLRQSGPVKNIGCEISYTA